MLEIIRRIEALSTKAEFTIVTLGAFGYFSFISAFNPSPLQQGPRWQGVLGEIY